MRGIGFLVCLDEFAEQIERDEIALLCRAIFDRDKLGCGFPHMGKHRLELLLCGGADPFCNFEPLVFLELEFGYNFDARGEPQWLALIDRHLIDLRFGNDAQFFVVNRMLKGMRDELIDDFLFNFLSKTLFDHSPRHTAWTKTG